MAYILFAAMDEGELRDLHCAARFFADRGHRTEVLEDGLDAMHRIRAEPPDVLVADVFLRGRDGLDLVREIKTRYPDRRIGTISFTIVSAELGAALGMHRNGLKTLDAILVKPSSEDLRRAAGYRIMCHTEQVSVTIGQLLCKLDLRDPDLPAPA
jgi:CheY-like chemotaxis protein